MGVGYIKLRIPNQTFDAHCGVCGCKVDVKFTPSPLAHRSAQGRPLGLLCLFLSRCPGNKAQHRQELEAIKAEVDESFARRSQARAECSVLHPLLAAWSAARERAPSDGVDVDGEPILCPYWPRIVA